MNKTLPTVLGLAVLGGIAYYFYRREHNAAAFLVKGGFASSAAVLKTFQPAYVDAWYRAAQKGADTFTYDNGTYHTQGGTAVR